MLTGLNHRSRTILLAAVTEYMASGQPVGSRTLARKYGLELSPATIRNVLSDLEDAGYLKQPHTSAGRVPTERAVRAFIEAITDFPEVPLAQREHMRAEFSSIFSHRIDGTEALRQSGRLVSEIAGTAAVVAPPIRDERTLTHLHFLPTKPGQLLAVLVYGNGMVENRYLNVDVDEGIDPAELLRIHNLLSDVVEGRSLHALRDMFQRRLSDERRELDQLRHRAFQLAEEALGQADERPRRVFIEGGERLLQFSAFRDPEQLQGLVTTLQSREQLVTLLEKTLGAGAVSIYVGGEAEELGGADLSLVVAPYGDASASGSVGILGPTRMDYAKMVPLVEAAAQAMTAALSRDDKG